LQVTPEAGGGVANFDNQVVLSETSVDQVSLRLGESVRVELIWRGLKPWDDNYTVFVHLIGPDGRVHGQVDRWPMQGTLPTSQWAAGQTVADSYDVVLPGDAPPGRYQVEVGWYLLSTLRRLLVVDANGLASGDHVVVGGFAVP
jgi:hypothetical protein